MYQRINERNVLIFLSSIKETLEYLVKERGEMNKRKRNGRPISSDDNKFQNRINTYSDDTYYKISQIPASLRNESVVVFSHAKKSFHVFSDLQKLERILEEGYFYWSEVTFQEGFRFHPFVDLDYIPSSYTVQQCLQEVREALVKVFLEDLHLPVDQYNQSTWNMVYCDNSIPEKQSVHLILRGFYFSSMNKQLEFTALLFERLSDPLKPCVDALYNWKPGAVNALKQHQQLRFGGAFRLPRSSKELGRPKKPLLGATFQESLVGIYPGHESGRPLDHLIHTNDKQRQYHYKSTSSSQTILNPSERPSREYNHVQMSEHWGRVFRLYPSDPAPHEIRSLMKLPRDRLLSKVFLHGDQMTVFQDPYSRCTDYPVPKSYNHIPVARTSVPPPPEKKDSSKDSSSSSSKDTMSLRHQTPFMSWAQLRFTIPRILCDPWFTEERYKEVFYENKDSAYANQLSTRTPTARWFEPHSVHVSHPCSEEMEMPCAVCTDGQAHMKDNYYHIHTLHDSLLVCCHSNDRKWKKAKSEESKEQVPPRIRVPFQINQFQCAETSGARVASVMHYQPFSEKKTLGMSSSCLKTIRCRTVSCGYGYIDVVLENMLRAVITVPCKQQSGGGSGSGQKKIPAPDLLKGRTSGTRSVTKEQMKEQFQQWFSQLFGNSPASKDHEDPLSPMIRVFGFSTMELTSPFFMWTLDIFRNPSTEEYHFLRVVQAQPLWLTGEWNINRPPGNHWNVERTFPVFTMDTLLRGTDYEYTFPMTDFLEESLRNSVILEDTLHEAKLLWCLGRMSERTVYTKAVVHLVFHNLWLTSTESFQRVTSTFPESYRLCATVPADFYQLFSDGYQLLPGEYPGHLPVFQKALCNVTPAHRNLFPSEVWATFVSQTEVTEDLVRYFRERHDYSPEHSDEYLTAAYVFWQMFRLMRPNEFLILPMYMGPTVHQSKSGLGYQLGRFSSRTARSRMISQLRRLTDLPQSVQEMYQDDETDAGPSTLSGVTCRVFMDRSLYDMISDIQQAILSTGVLVVISPPCHAHETEKNDILRLLPSDGQGWTAPKILQYWTEISSRRSPSLEQEDDEEQDDYHGDKREMIVEIPYEEALRYGEHLGATFRFYYFIRCAREEHTFFTSTWPELVKQLSKESSTFHLTPELSQDRVSAWVRKKRTETTDGTWGNSAMLLLL